MSIIELIDKSMQQYILNSQDIRELIEGIQYLTKNDYLTGLEFENYLQKEAKLRIRYQTNFGYSAIDLSHYYRNLKEFIADFDQNSDKNAQDVGMQSKYIKVNVEDEKENNENSKENDQEVKETTQEEFEDEEEVFQQNLFDNIEELTKKAEVLQRRAENLKKQTQDLSK